jgi:type I restriction enzyme, S subunit
VLARVDACRDRLARVAPLLKRFRQSVLAAATSGQLTEDWRLSAGQPFSTAPFERLLSPRPGALKRGPFGSSIKKSFFVPWGFKVYEQKNAIQDDETLGTYFLDEAKFAELEDFAVAPGDFIVSCAGTIGRISRLSQSAAKGVINQALMRIRIDESVVSARYFRLLFESPWFQQAILEKTQGSAMQNMAAVKVIKHVTVSLPSSSEQAEIVRRVETLFAFADRLEARLARAQTAVDRLTPSLLAKAFRGELVPQDPADEPASELLARLAKSTANAGNDTNIKRPRGRPKRAA